MIDKIDKMVSDLVELSSIEIEKAKTKGYFSKDLAEACGIVISLAYGRWGNDDK